MLGRDGFVQACNGQAAVDADNQVIVAHHLTANASDHDGLLALVDATSANLAGLVERQVRRYVAAGRAKHPADSTRRGGGPLTAAMRRRIRQGATAAVTGCASMSSNPSSVRSRLPEASGSSCSAASSASATSGRCSAPPLLPRPL